MSTDIEVRKEQLSLLARELAPFLRRGLPCCLQESADDVDGVGAGVEAVRALVEITKLVSAGNRDQDKALEDLLHQLGANLAQFCEVDDVPARVGILLEIQCPMEILLAELRGPGAPGAMGEGPLVLRLSSDVERLLERADTFSRMAQELSAFSSTTSRQARRDRIALFCDRYDAYSALLDFQDSTVLEDKACRNQLTEWLETETRDLLSLAWRVHEEVYAGDRGARATADWQSDLREETLRPVLASLLEPGVDTLARLSRLFEDAVQVAGGEASLYRRFTTLGLEIERLERAAA